MTEGKWVVLKEYSHATHYGWDDGSRFLNPDRPYYTMTATVKQDGCVDFHRYFNGSEEGDKDPEVDYLHICGLDDFIETLKKLSSV